MAEVLAALLDSWDRNNTITVNLLRAIAPGDLDVTPADGSPSIAALFMHMHYCRLIFVHEDAPERLPEPPSGEWRTERDRDRMVQMLNDSAQAVREAVEGRLISGREMDVHYDHPLLMFQHLIWHEGYHHGQIKLTLKMAGRPFDNEAIGALTWDVWMKKDYRW